MTTTALASARDTFSKAGLPFPPIPDDLAAAVQEWEPWHWGTRADAPGLYRLDTYVDELLNGTVRADYLQFGHDGHGINSYALHYYLVRGPLAVLDQIAWGGAYHDNAAAAQTMADHWAQIKVLIEALDQALARQLIPTDERFVVILSDLSGSRWGRVSEGLNWHEDADNLNEATLAAREIVETNP